MASLKRYLMLGAIFFIAVSPVSSEVRARSSSPNVRAQPSLRVLVASWCVHCRDLERFLRERSIAYTSFDIEKDPEGKKLYGQLGGGGVPVVIVGNSVLKGFDKEAILDLIERARPAKTNSAGI